MNRLAGARRPGKLETHYHRVRVAVVLVKAGETKEKAWRRYLEEHPEYHKNDVKIFHFIH